MLSVWYTGARKKKTEQKENTAVSKITVFLAKRMEIRWYVQRSKIAKNEKNTIILWLTDLKI